MPLKLVLFIFGLLLIGIGGIGSILAYRAEIKASEPKYIAIMKIFSLMIAVGGFLCGWAGV